MDLTVIGKEAKAASRILGRLNVEEKNKGLKAAADALKAEDNIEKILAANKEDIENAKNKYFKPVKRIVDNSLMYFVSSILLVVYNILFTKYVVVALIIFYVTSYLTIVVNNLKNREDDAKEEYIKWLEFKNYLKTNSLDELDISSLENYATYAYALDEYDNFLVALNKKYLKDEHVFDKSILLSIMNFRIFDEVEEVLRKSIKIARNKYVFLFKRNKGRKI